MSGVCGFSVPCVLMLRIGVWFGLNSLVCGLACLRLKVNFQFGLGL